MFNDYPHNVCITGVRNLVGEEREIEVIFKGYA